MSSNVLAKNRSIFLYGAALAALLFLLRWLQLRLLIINNAFEIYIGSIALVFTVLGIWLALKISAPRIKTVIVEREILVSASPAAAVNEEEIARLGLSRRELEVLGLMAEGLSNQEIAARLFVSLNTVKTHSSRVFEKMDVRRRTQAVEKAKRLLVIR